MEFLANELIVEIFLNLDSNDIGKLFQVNSQFREFSLDGRIIKHIQKSRREIYISIMYQFRLVRPDARMMDLNRISWDNTPICYDNQEAIHLTCFIPYARFRKSVDNTVFHIFQGDTIRNIHIFGEETTITLSCLGNILYTGSSKKFPTNLVRPFLPLCCLVANSIVFTSESPVNMIFDVGFLDQSLTEQCRKKSTFSYCCDSTDCDNPLCIKHLCYRKKSGKYKTHPTEIEQISNFEQFVKLMDCFYDTSICGNALCVSQGSARLKWSKFI